jgi:plastocyanin domain-containing protein
MKNLLAFFLFYVGAIVCVTCRADSLLADQKVYKSTTAPDGIQHVHIEGGSYFFKPSRVIVRVNVPVELAVSVDSGVVPHSLVIQAPEAGIMVDEKLSPATKIVRFTPTKTGKYPFYCNNKLLFFMSHREKGMEGLLDVVD